MSIRIIIVWLMCLMALPMTACGPTGGPFKGRVFDEQTGKPIVGAHVTVTWTGEVGLFVDSQSTCVHTEIAVSDEDGRFHVGRWVNTERAGVIMDRHVSAIAYAPDYRMADSYFPNKLAMIPVVGSQLERLKYLLEMMYNMHGCGDIDESKSQNYRQSIYSEASELVQASEKNGLVQNKEYYEILIRLLTEIELDKSGFGIDKPDFDAGQAATIRRKLLNLAFNNAIVCTKYQTAPKEQLDAFPPILFPGPSYGEPGYGTWCIQREQGPLNYEQTDYIRGLFTPYSPLIKKYLADIEIIRPEIHRLKHTPLPWSSDNQRDQ